MNIETNVTPPTGWKGQSTYREIIDALRTTRGWIAVPLADLDLDGVPTPKSAKQVRVLAACKNAGLNVRTKTDDTKLYICVKSDS